MRIRVLSPHQWFLAKQSSTQVMPVNFLKAEAKGIDE